MKRDGCIAVACALRGRGIWYFLKHKFAQYKKFIIFPENNQEYNAWGIVMLQSYLIKENLKSAVVIASNRNVEKAINILNMRNVKIQLLKAKYIDEMLKYYALVDMSRLWTVVSVSMPYDTGAERLLGIEGITRKEIVYYDVFGFSNQNIEDEIGENIWETDKVKAILEE